MRLRDVVGGFDGVRARQLIEGHEWRTGLPL